MTQETKTHVPKILIVDDEALVCWSIEKTLRKAGYETISADSGEKAIEKLRSSSFDLIITDMKLPNADGFDVAATAKRLLPLTPVIMISAFGDEAAHEKASTMKIDCFVDKPFDLSEIASIVRWILVKNEMKN